METFSETNLNIKAKDINNNPIANYYITGDKHGEFLDVKKFCDKQHTSTNDILVVLGDAGINYFLNYRDILTKDFIKYIPITLFCIHGNHEERPYNIESYKLIDFKGGKAYQEEMFPNIIFAKDGEIYDFNGKKVVCLGGAYSVDKGIRLANGWNWFESEQPNDEIKSYVEKQLARVNWKVDVVFSHTCPATYIPTDCFMPGINHRKVDKSTESWLGSIEYKLDFDKWFCGHWHIDRYVHPIKFVFNDFLEL